MGSVESPSTPNFFFFITLKPRVDLPAPSAQATFFKHFVPADDPSLPGFAILPHMLYDSWVAAMGDRGRAFFPLFFPDEPRGFGEKEKTTAASDDLFGGQGGVQLQQSMVACFNNIGTAAARAATPSPSPDHASPVSESKVMVRFFLGRELFLEQAALSEKLWAVAERAAARDGQGALAQGVSKVAIKFLETENGHDTHTFSVTSELNPDR